MPTILGTRGKHFGHQRINAHVLKTGSRVVLIVPKGLENDSLLHVLPQFRQVGVAVGSVAEKARLIRAKSEWHVKLVQHIAVEVQVVVPARDTTVLLVLNGVVVVGDERIALDIVVKGVVVVKVVRVLEFLARDRIPVLQHVVGPVVAVIVVNAPSNGTVVVVQKEIQVERTPVGYAGFALRFVIERIGMRKVSEQHSEVEEKTIGRAVSLRLYYAFSSSFSEVNPLGRRRLPMETRCESDEEERQRRTGTSISDAIMSAVISLRHDHESLMVSDGWFRDGVVFLGHVDIIVSLCLCFGRGQFLGFLRFKMQAAAAGILLADGGRRPVSTGSPADRARRIAAFLDWCNCTVWVLFPHD